MKVTLESIDRYNTILDDTALIKAAANSSNYIETGIGAFNNYEISYQVFSEV